MSNQQATLTRSDADNAWILTIGVVNESIKMNPTSGLWTCGMYNANFDLSGMIETIMVDHGVDPQTQDVYLEAVDLDFPDEEEE